MVEAPSVNVKKTTTTVHRSAGLIRGRSLLSRILGLLLVWAAKAEGSSIVDEPGEG